MIRPRPTDVLQPLEALEVRRRLDGIEWCERPGEQYRVLEAYGFTFEETVTICNDCKQTWPNLFGLHNHVWLSLAAKKEILCLECTEKRLGRQLTLEDFKDVPVNKDYVYLLRTRGK